MAIWIEVIIKSDKGLLMKSYLLLLVLCFFTLPEPVLSATEVIKDNLPASDTGKPVIVEDTIKPESMVFTHRVKGPMQRIYKQLFTALENNGYYVIFEPNIGRNLAHFEKRWGKEYNQNKLDAVRSMVFCSGWYANKISNLDPDMLALCPLHVTLIHKQDTTSILFVRPGSVSAGSPANAVALELEQDVVRIIKDATSR